jgi:glucose dehydrogenase
MLFTALLTMTLPLAVLAQTADDLKNDEKTTGDVLVYGMGYSANRFSPLTQINKDNVAKLVPVWAYSLADLQGGEGFPVVKDGVIYVTTHNATAAVDAMTGKQIWRVLHDYPPESLRVVCCGIVNRGAAIYEGMIIRALMDDRLVALDAKTGKEIWMVHSPEPVIPANGYAMTGAPLVVKGIVIMGVAGAEFSHRGLLEGYDAKTGKHLCYSSTMVTASNLVFTGVMTGEFQALDADTGKILWSFQTPSGIVGQPVTWDRNGKQYVTVMSGIGGVYAQRAGDPNLANLPTGVSLWTFALFDK